MQRMVVRIVSLGTLLALGSLALGQSQPGDQKAKTSPGIFEQGSAPPKPDTSNLFDDRGKPLPKSDNKPAKPVTSNLEELLSQAMQNNPDIRVAEAKVREAEAELHRIWLQVAQKVIGLHSSLEPPREKVKREQARVDLMERSFRNGAITLQSLQTARDYLAIEKAKLAPLEAEMNSLTGKLPQGLMGRGNVRLWDAVRSDMLSAVTDPADLASGLTFSSDKLDLTAARRLQLTLNSREVLSVKPPIAGSMADRIRKAFDTPITVDYKGKLLPDVFKDLQQKTPGITFVTTDLNDMDDKKHLLIGLSLHFSEPTPLGAVLQAIEDAAGLRIGVREYGVLVLHWARQLPEGAIPLHQFLKSRPDGEKPKTEGVVKSIDPTTGLITINIGTTAGLFEDQILDVYRLKPEAKYLGKIKVVAARPNQAIAERFSAPGQIPGREIDFQVGDQVTGSLKASGR